MKEKEVENCRLLDWKIVHGTRTWDSMMVGADESTEL